MRSRSFSALALCLFLVSAAFAAPAKPQGAAAEFHKLYSDWNQILARLYQLQERFQSEANIDKKALMEQRDELLAKARQIAEPLAEAADRAYLEAPNKDPKVKDFLVANLVGDIKGDNYEKALKSVKMLLDNNADDKTVALMAGIAYFATNDFDNAEKYLTQAKENGLLARDPLAQRYLSAIPYYKQIWKREVALREAEEKKDNLPRVKIATSKGDIVVELFEDQAPIATANFITLVEKKFYDGTKFHRVIPNFMAQGGDPKGDGSGGPGHTIPCECAQDNARMHFRGSLSMAHAGKDTGGSQFFLTFLPTTHLDRKHTVFGRIVEGLDVLEKLQRLQPGDPAPADQIVKATVLRKRKHEYKAITRPDTR